MTWLVELPDPSGDPMLVNLDQPMTLQPDGSQTMVTTAVGQFAVGLGYDALCERLRLNPLDRIATRLASRPARKLGRKPARRDARVPRLAAVAPILPPAPPTCTAYVDAVGSWILGANDRVGDCTCVAPANVILALTTLAQAPKRLDDKTILGFYSSVTGYDPADPSTDEGAAVEDVLAAWHKRGLGGDRLDGFASLPLDNRDRFREAIAHLGPVDLGVNFPEGWMQAAIWDVATAGPSIAGGHCVAAVGYTEAGPLVVSWGQVFTLTWAGWDAYVDEAHVLLSRDGLRASGKDAEGVDWVALEGFMTSMQGDAA